MNPQCNNYKEKPLSKTTRSKNQGKKCVNWQQLVIANFLTETRELRG